jgi:hypothetical protein
MVAARRDTRKTAHSSNAAATDKGFSVDTDPVPADRTHAASVHRSRTTSACAATRGRLWRRATALAGMTSQRSKGWRAIVGTRHVTVTPQS